MSSNFTCGQFNNCSKKNVHWPPERVKVLGKIFSLLFALFFTTSLSFGQGVGSTAVNFEVDANFQSNNRPSFWNFTNPNQNYFNNVNGDDWSKGATGNAVLKQLGGVSVPGLTADRSALWQVDGNWGTNVPPDLSVFGGTSNKNGNPIGAGQSPYTVSSGSGGPQKNDITNVYLHTRRNPANNNLWLFFGAETRSVNGSSYLDFEYNQAGVTVANGYMTGDGPLNGRSLNDVLLVINYTKGGSVPVVGIRKWLATGTWSDELTLPANSTYMSTNALDIPAVAPGKAFAGDGTPSSTTIAYQFVEGAINVSVLDLGGLADACTPNATITIKTRSSASYTSELKDWDIMRFPLTPTAMAAVADITPICAAASGANTFNVTGTYADGTPLWSTTAGTLSNQVYNADGTASATLSLPAGTLSATVKLTTTSSNSACQAAMSSKTATVYPRPVVVASATPAGPLSILTVPPQYALHTTVDGVLDPSSGYSFSWVQDPPTGGLDYTTIPNPTFSAPAAGDYTWTVTVTNANGCINPSSVSRILIAQAPCPAVNRPPMCAGTTYTFSADVGPAPSGETWKWTANNGATVNAPDNAQSVSVTAGTQNFTLTLTKTYANPALSPQVCPYSVTVIPQGQVNQPVNQTVCNGANTTAVTFSTTNVGGTTTYAWTNNTASIGLPASGTGDVGAFAAVNSTSAPVVATIIVTPTYTINGVSCSGPTKTFTITVNPSGQVNQPGSQTVCNGANTAEIKFATTNTGGTTTFAWTNNAASIGLAASGTGDIAPFAAINTGTVPVVATIVVTPTFANGGISCTGPTKTFTITVNPTGQVNQPGNQTLCNGANTAEIKFATTNTGGTTTYAWTNNTTSIGLAASGNGDIGSFAAINTGTSPVVATIVVTPTFANGGVSCTGPTKTFTITVNPTGQVNQPGNQTLCNGANTTTITFATTNTGGTTTYAWTNNAVSIGLAASGSGTITSFAAVNNGTAPVVATITVTPTFSNGGISCAGPAKTFTITVNPTGQVNQPANQTLCNGFPTTLINFSTGNTGGTTTYSWTNSATSIGLAASGSGSSIPSFTATNTGTTPVIATIVVTPTFSNGGVSCVGPSKSFTITVNPDAALPVVSMLPIGCTDLSFSIQITPQSTTTYDIYQLDNNHVVKAPPHASPLIVSGLHLSQGYRVIATSAAGCKSAPADCGNFSAFNPNAVPATPANNPVVESSKSNTDPKTTSQVSPIENVKIALTAGRSSITATPNPFSDMIRFNIISEVSGQGSLELFTMMGQKIKTVYQGYFEKSVLRTFEYHVPLSERANLVYLFSIGNQKTSGKLIGIK